MGFMRAMSGNVRVNRQPYSTGPSINGPPEFIHFEVDFEDREGRRWGFPKYCPRFDCFDGTSKGRLIVMFTVSTLMAIAVVSFPYSRGSSKVPPTLPGLVSASNSTSPGNNPLHDADKTRAADIRNQLVTVSGTAALKDDDSAQYKAYTWLLDEDPLQLKAHSPFLKQRYVLAVLFFSLDGPNWTNGDPWIVTLGGDDDFFLNENPENIGLEAACSWEGVDCDEDNHISELYLGSAGLNGQVPFRELQFLTHIKLLDLSGNAIAGSLPNGLASFDLLETLLLDNTNITGTVPDNFCTLPSLQRITADCHEVICSCCDNCGGGIVPVAGPPSTTGSASQNPVPTTNTEEQTREVAITNLLQKVSADSVITTGAPQNLALNWILYGDDQRASVHDTHLIQRYVLAVIYYSLGGEKWPFASSWLSGTSSECEYPGVACNDNGVITTIALVASGLTGSIPKEIGLLDDLNFLDFSNNKIGGVIPIQLANLEELESLLLHDNGIRGAVPMLICNLRETGLKELKVDCDTDPPKVTCDCCTNCEIGTANIVSTVSPTGFPTPESTYERIDYAVKYGRRGQHIAGILETYAEEVFQADTSWSMAADWIIATDPLELESSDPNLVQRWVLAVLYFQLDGVNWSYETFLSGSSECDWDQITCDEDGSITSITLTDGGLKGEVPPQLAGLTKLTILDLRGNELSGEAPEVLCLEEDVNSQFKVLVLDCNTPSTVDCGCCTPCS